MPEVAGSDAAKSLLDMKIIEQLEYYFGDFNMLKDKFLRNEITKDEGWVPITTLLRFNRLAALTKDVNVILNAFKNNPSTLIEINEINGSVRRNPGRPVPEAGESWRDLVAERTIYVKGFPTETTTLDDILNFMTTFGKVDNVYERRYFDKALKQWKSKGSAYVAFPTKEDAEQFLSIGSVKFSGHELIRKWQNDYIEEKKNERLKNKLEVKQAKNQLLKEQQEGLIKNIVLPKGALISLSGLSEGIGVNELKTRVINLGWDVDFVDYTMGAPTAYIRLQTENSAKEALAKLTDSSFDMKGVTVKAALVEGEEEEKLLEKMLADKKLRIAQNVVKSGKKGYNKGKKNKFSKRGRHGDFEKDTKEKEEKPNGTVENVDVKQEKMETENGESKPKTEPGAASSSGEGALKRKKEDEDSVEQTSKKTKSEE